MSEGETPPVAREASAPRPVTTPGQSRRMRNTAIGLLVGLFAVLLYLTTLAKLGGGGLLNHPG